jgi:hypothetical protein
MLTISEAQRRTELFLTGQMLEALRAVEYELPSFDTQLHEVDLAEVARARVEIRHVEQKYRLQTLVGPIEASHPNVAHDDVPASKFGECLNSQLRAEPMCEESYGTQSGIRTAAAFGCVQHEGKDSQLTAAE